jgi:hypothetical protein
MDGEPDKKYFDWSQYVLATLSNVVPKPQAVKHRSRSQKTITKQCFEVVQNPPPWSHPLHPQALRDMAVYSDPKNCTLSAKSENFEFMVFATVETM